MTEIKNVMMDKDVVLVPIPELDFDPNYLANIKEGKIYSKKSGRYLDPKPNKRFGYMYTSINGRGYSIHVLIMSAAMGVKSEYWRKMGLEVNHMKGKRKNGIDDLCLCTRKQQYDERFDPTIKEKMRNKRYLNEDEVIEIKSEWVDYEGEKKSTFINEWVEKLGCSYSAIEDILNGKTWVSVEA